MYAELVRNRDFESLGRGHLNSDTGRMPSSWSRVVSELKRKHDAGVRAGQPLDPEEPAADPSDHRPWKAVRNATLAVVQGDAPFASNPHALRVCVSSPGGGVSNPGYWGIAVRPGVSFKLTIFARAAKVAVRLVPQLLERGSGRVLTMDSVLLVGADDRAWHRYNTTIHVLDDTVHTESTAWLQIILLDPGEVILDGVSLMPSDAVAGLFRRDIFERLQRLRPGFVRMPGGNYLEGHGKRTCWDWKQTLGPAAARRGHYNSAWKYWVTDALGLFELLLLAELLGTEAQISIHSGYSLNQLRYPPLADATPVIQDALDLLEFANGPPHSPWGARRAEMGHPQPFGLHRLEIGNEERDWRPEGYPGHYRLIASAVWARHPHVHITACGFWDESLSSSISRSPCLSGTRCDAWDEHIYRTAPSMAAMGHHYDHYNRSWPRVFVGEFAAKDSFDKESALRPTQTQPATLHRSPTIIPAGMRHSRDIWRQRRVVQKERMDVG